MVSANRVCFLSTPRSGEPGNPGAAWVNTEEGLDSTSGSRAFMSSPDSDVEDLQTPLAIREQVRSWIEKNWDESLSLLEWRHRLVDSGWAVPSWSKSYCGLGLPAWSVSIVKAELANAGAVGLPVGGGVTLAAPTILAHGPDPIRARFLQPILTGEETWCQLFSEPGAGSDLAGLTTKAQLDGDEWVVNGQKVWNTSAHHADMGMLVARTDWDVPKHNGLTYFVLPMKQSGVEVRPLRQMNNYASFNEVFLTDARIPIANVVGEVGNGWAVALTTLGFERNARIDSRPSSKFGQGSCQGRATREAGEEAEEYFETYKWYPQRMGRVDLVLDQAKATGRATEPIVRQEVARLLTMNRIAGWTATRAQAARSLGRTPGPEGSIGKLSTSNIARQAAKVHSMIAGANGMLTGPESPLGGTIAEILVSVPAQSIAGGTDEIQRNIIAEKQLGLPKEPTPDNHKPFRSVPRNS